MFGFSWKQIIFMVLLIVVSSILVVPWAMKKLAALKAAPSTSTTPATGA